MVDLIRRKIRQRRERLNEFLNKEARVRDLLKATLPLWVFTILACGAGFFAVVYDRAQSCRSGRSDIGEFIDRLTELNPDADPTRVAVIDKLVQDFIDDCPL